MQMNLRIRQGYDKILHLSPNAPAVDITLPDGRTALEMFHMDK